MPKAIIEYDLTDIDEEKRFKEWLNGLDAPLIIWDLDQWLRTEVKYADHPPEIEDVYQAIRDKLHEFMNDYEYNHPE